MSPIEFYFDFSSPYGYLASTQIDDIAARHGLGVEWCPYLVGTAMKATGHQPMINTPMLHDYVLVDVPRFARLLGVPLTLADSFPLVATAASRGYYWLQDQDPRLAHEFAKATYHAFFVEGRDISSTDELRAVADSCGADGERLAEATRDQAVKDLFRRKNDAALAKGVFGSPYILVNGEPFWGADRLYQVEQWLATGGW